MIDSFIKPHLAPHLDNAASKISHSGLTANYLTVVALLVGLGACFFVAMQLYTPGLLLVLVNRAVNGVAGAFARRHGPTELGTMLDTLCDFIFFAMFVFLFTLSMEGTALAAAFLLFAYLVMGMAYLSHVAANAVRNLERPRGGIVENAEMTIFMVLCCLMPNMFPALAALFGLICLASAGLRINAAIKTIRA